MAEVETPCITILAPNSLWFFWLRGTRCDGDSSIYQSDPVRRRARSDPCSPNHYLDWTRRKIHLFLSTDGWTKVDRLVPPPRSRLWLASLRHRTPLNPSARLSVVY